MRERMSPPNATIVVMIDEAERVEPHSTAAATLQSLHEGGVGNIPVLAVFAGLGYLHSHLQKDGILISRYADDSKCVHTLERFNNTECLTLFGQWLDHFDVSAHAAEIDRWGDALIRDTSGWPMHITGFLAALGKEILQSGDERSLHVCDMDTVRRQAALLRNRYYDGRYRGTIDANVRWTGAAMTALGDTAKYLREDATAIIQAVQPQNVETRADATAMFDALVRRGFLQREGTGLKYSCPIPSLVSHTAIGAMKNPGLHIATALGNVDKVRGALDQGIDIEERDALGRTPLLLAADCQWADVAAALLEAGANPDAKDKLGVSARIAWPEYEWLANAPDGVRESPAGHNKTRSTARRTSPRP